jgi:hypothetical protein
MDLHYMPTTIQAGLKTNKRSLADQETN